MKTLLHCIGVIVSFSVLTACSSYSEDDYGKASTTERESLCVNMEPAQEEKCKEREQNLVISIGADKNCNHPYEYERNRCRNDKAKQEKQLEQSLKKHK